MKITFDLMGLNFFSKVFGNLFFHRENTPSVVRRKTMFTSFATLIVFVEKRAILGKFSGEIRTPAIALPLSRIVVIPDPGIRIHIRGEIKIFPIFKFFYLFIIGSDLPMLMICFFVLFLPFREILIEEIIEIAVPVNVFHSPFDIKIPIVTMMTLCMIIHVISLLS